MAYSGRSRTRKRVGNDGGGFPLGQILALSLGGGEANPAIGAQKPGDVDPSYRGDPEKAIRKFGTTQPYRRNNPFQKFYGMDDEDRANIAYRTGQLEAEAALQRQLGAIPKISEAKTAAEIAADRAVRAEAVRLLAPTLERAGLLPTSPLNSLAATEDYLNLYGIPGGTPGLLPSFGAGETALSTGLEARYARPRLKEQTEAEQGAKTSKAKLETTAAEQERGARERFPSEVEKGLRGEFLRSSLYPVGGLAFDITDPRYAFTATPETRGGIDPLTGAFLAPTAPELLRVTPEGVIRNRTAAPAPTPTAAPALTAPKKSAFKTEPPKPAEPQVFSPVNTVPSLSFDYKPPKSPEQIALEQQAAAQVLEALRKKLRESPYVRGY